MKEKSVGLRNLLYSLLCKIHSLNEEEFQMTIKVIKNLIIVEYFG
jgi:hypothetical protein